MKTLVSLLFILAAVLSSSAIEKVAPPNVILIISDDQGFPDYGFMGGKNVSTPRIDKLAAGSMLYTRGYTLPVCSPSLATLLTGHYPHVHGITGNDLGKPGAGRAPLTERLLKSSLILPKALSEAGYLTFQAGKLWNTTFSEVGFTGGMTGTVGRHGGAGLKIGREGLRPIFDFIEDSRTKEKPFFLWYAPMMPHDPHTPPERLLAKYRGQGPTAAAEKYYAMVEWFDETCGELDDYLAQNNLTNNTVVLYLADNGWDAARGMSGMRSKLSPYELGVRTPMFVRWPGKVQPLRDDETLASIIDFVPTILKVCGVPVPAELPGLNLLDRKAMTARKSICLAASTHDIADLNHPSMSLTARVVIEGWWKLLLPGAASAGMKRAAAPTKPELFDLKADPLEASNLAEQKPEEVTRLSQSLDAWWKAE